MTVLAAKLSTKKDQKKLSSLLFLLCASSSLCFFLLKKIRLFKKGDTDFRQLFFRGPLLNRPKSGNLLFFFEPPPKKTESHKIPPSKVVCFIRLSYLRLKFFVSKGVFIHKITSEGCQTIREGRARVWEPENLAMVEGPF